MAPPRHLPSSPACKAPPYLSWSLPSPRLCPAAVRTSELDKRHWQG
uniref:Uncharacterized protein n=1 Tax=Arundo donax TaxID=35708 RepID=A0A0A9AQZ1_ARUDO